MIHLISPEPLTFELLETLMHGGHRLALSDESRRLITDCKQYLDHKLETSKDPIYGINTGFGSLCKIRISKNDLSQLQANLIKSHACSIGTMLIPEIIRLMLILKAHALSLGHSGVQVQTVERILDLYNNNVLPVVRELGSLGASGDLAPLANLFLPLIGEGEVMYEGKIMDSATVCKHFGWEPITLGAKEGLALLNGTQFMSSHAVYALIRGRKLTRLADTIGALSLEAYNGRIEPFFDCIQAIRRHPGQLETARRIRELVEGSEFMAQTKTHVQDPYSFRCMPQVHGAVKDTQNYVASVVNREINSVTDNPTIFPEEDLIISGGNFHGEPLAFVLDFYSISLSELGNISERRTYRLISGDRQAPEFLVSNPGLNSGFMIPQYAAAAVVSQNKQLCTPCSVDSIPSSNEQEDHVSMGGNAATKTVRVVNNLERILAIELLNAAQAVEMQRPLHLTPELEDFMRQFRERVPFCQEDRVMYRLIDSAILFLQKVVM